MESIENKKYRESIGKGNIKMKTYRESVGKGKYREEKV